MPDTLVPVGILSQHFDDPNWVVFDCRFDLAQPDAGYQAYLSGHIRGAAYAHLEHHLSGAKTGSNGRHPLPPIEAFERFMRDHGVTRETQVVAYDGRDGMYAARLWWLLRWLGHAHVAVLDGGLAAWQEAGLPLDQSTEAGHLEGDFTAHADASRVADLTVLQTQGGGVTLVDARLGPRYRGEVEPLDRVAGHIPGALNRPYTENLDGHGRFLPPQQLREQFAALLEARDASTIVHQCGSGVSACHNLLAMEVAGLTGSRLYPGSWSEWSSDPMRPVATGPQPGRMP